MAIAYRRLGPRRSPRSHDLTLAHPSAHERELQAEPEADGGYEQSP